MTTTLHRPRNARGLSGVIVRRPRAVLVAWAVGAAAALAVAGGAVGGEGLFDRLQSGAPDAPGEARVAFDLQQQYSDGTDFVGLTVTGADLADPALVSAVVPLVEAARSDLAALPGVVAVADPFGFPAGDPRRDAFLAVPGDGFLVTVTTSPDAGLEGARTVAERLETLSGDIEAAAPGADAAVGGGLLVEDEITSQVETDLRTGELVALPLSLLVMIIVFGGFLAAGVPIVGALASIAGALVCLFGFSFLLDLDSSVVSVVSVLGLGLCIDYGLLIVSRYREELLSAGPPVSGDAERARLQDALVRTMATAGRTVAFSGITVALSLAGLLVFQTSVIRAVGAAGLSAVAVALLVALTLVPALLRVAGSAIDRPGLVMRLPVVGGLARRLGDVPGDDGAFSRLARRVQRRPVTVSLVVAAVLAILAIPVSRLELRASGVEFLPIENEQRQFFDTFASDYPLIANPPITVVAATPDLQAVDSWASGLTSIGSVRAVSPAEPLGPDNATDDIQLSVDDAVGPEARQAVRDIRTAGDDAPFETYVGGNAANLEDLVESLVDRAPIAIGIVVLATLALLFLMTGSLLIPIKALVLNVLSLGASLGVLVVVFQYGFGEDLLGFTSTGGIEIVIVPLALAFGFGLSMDYEVFLLSRIKEFHDGGMATDESVVMGLQRSGRIITSAALILVIVFVGFASGKLLVKEMGVALTVAIALDATLVRILLVPATMTWLKEWNWWAPAPLRRLHSRFGISD
jgi:RND superfamily putative drug exporter